MNPKKPILLKLLMRAEFLASKKDPHASTRLLGLIAEAIERDIPLPADIKSFLVFGLSEATNGADLDDSRDMLQHGLRIKGFNRPTISVPAWAVATFVDDPKNGPSQTLRIEKAEKKFGIGRTSIKKLLSEGRREILEAIANLESSNTQYRDLKELSVQVAAELKHCKNIDS